MGPFLSYEEVMCCEYGPRLLGPRLVGPMLVGPRLVGPRLVGPFKQTRLGVGTATSHYKT